ncbi:MAG TPA: PAS domain S-box protein, partial [Pyrinomonadaceae bacterium]
MVRRAGEQWAGGRAGGDSEGLARATLDALAEHVAVLDERGTILAVNRAWREFAAANSQSARGLAEGANYFSSCENARGEGAEDGARFAEGLRAVIEGALDEFTLEYPCHSPTEQRWFIARVTRFVLGGAARAVVTHVNITKRKLAEQRLARSEEWQSAILGASRDGIVVEDGERVFYVNNSYALLLGYSRPEELSGAHVSLLVGPDDRERMREYGRRRLRGEPAPTSYEFKGRRRDGALIDLEASV